MRNDELLDRLDDSLGAIEQSGPDGACPQCEWRPEDGPQHPTTCPVGAMRESLDSLDEVRSGAAADESRPAAPQVVGAA
jgi:hypothetical protein